MKKNPFTNIKTMEAHWDETGRTQKIPTVKVLQSPDGGQLVGAVIKEYLGDGRCLGKYLPFICGQDIKAGDILHDVEAFELKLRGSGDTIWRLRVKSNQYDN